MRWDTPARAMFDSWFEGPPERTEREAAELLREVGWPQEPGQQTPSPSQQTVNRIRRGDSRPDEDRWPLFRIAFGIPEIAWLTDAGRGDVPVPEVAPPSKDAA